MRIICGIYKITTPSNKVYIGQSVDIEKRRKQHQTKKKRYKCLLHSSLIKYGFENCKFEIVEECEDYILNEREIYWINYYNTLDPKCGLNLKSGGSRGKHSESTKKKLSKRGKGRTPWNKGKKGCYSEEILIDRRGKVRSEETKQKIKNSLAKLNKPAWNKGIPHSIETRKKMSEVRKGKPSPRKGVIISEETKKKIGEGNRGKYGYWNGKKHSDETKDKIRRVRLGKKLSQETIKKRTLTRAKNKISI